MQAHQVLEKLQPIHSWHFDVQRQHVGLELLDLVARDVGVCRRANDLDLAVSREDFGEQLAHQRRVVHHEYSNGHQKSSTDPATSDCLRRSL